MSKYDVKKVDINTLFPDPDEGRYKKQGIARMCNLVRTALNDQHIHHIQFNCQDKNVLLDAQKHPEKYPTLMVRVAGYSVYFTDLNTTVQNDVISRTEHHF
ncbi:glycine radical domain-containing protein [Clostridium magnum]|uniref:4-hydroxyphenylacetate decarboxylase large subunit n=1 Tax=Clostridium magnum DSM 2767 TaxID=1121326 RepID=A0A162R0G9_9CLOT|nr:glycine radical domain-containing protein [Clostridium magnum]KZL89237.1 4-hydroxyphenylacetate decarboxylase large subunit [Clostridium magnum DSM 2767]SHJ55801.1 Glycine radical [Clostridium magnum DSM 2767]